MTRMNRATRDGLGWELVGPGEIAERLGVERNSVINWARRHGEDSATPFPEPVAVLASGRGSRPGHAQASGLRVYLWSEVEKWATNTGRTE